MTALFYNFAPARVAKALPAAWEIAGPQVVLAAREASAVAALARYGVTDDETVRTAAQLAGSAAQQASVDGRALFAANLALPVPTNPIAALWHATTLLREHRGDGHVAVLAAAGISGRESTVLDCAAGMVPADYMRQTRHYDDSRAACMRAEPASRGLLADDGSLTPAGRDLKNYIEASTDALSLRAFDGLRDAEVETLLAALTPIAHTVIAGGDMPAVTPMTLRRNF